MPAARRPKAAKKIEEVPLDPAQESEEQEPLAPAAKSRKVATPDSGAVETKEQPQPERPTPPATYPEGVPDGIILEPGAPVVIEGEDDGAAIIVSRNVYRKIIPFNAKRPTYILLYARGTQVLKSRLQPAPK